jgi:hypothetical protein
VNSSNKATTIAKERDIGSLSEQRIYEELEQVVASREKPDKSFNDNGTEFTSTEALKWCQPKEIREDYIQPRKRY